MENLQSYNQKVEHFDPRDYRRYLLSEAPVIFEGRIFSNWREALEAKTGEPLLTAQ